jgi:hypothetical protein
MLNRGRSDLALSNGETTLGAERRKPIGVRLPNGRPLRRHSMRSTDGGSAYSAHRSQTCLTIKSIPHGALIYST